MARLFQGEEEFDRYDVVMLRPYVVLNDDGAVIVACLPSPREGSPPIPTILSSPGAWHGAALLTADFQDVQLIRDEHSLMLRLRLRGDALEIHDPKQDEWGGWSGQYQAV